MQRPNSRRLPSDIQTVALRILRMVSNAVDVGDLRGGPPVDPARVQRGDVLALIEPLLASDEDNVADEIEDDDAFGDVCLFKSGGTMPLVTVFNLRREDRLSDLEEATRRALISMPELAINDYEIDLVPILSPDDFDGAVTRINVDLWERTERTKEALQELATRLARAFQATAGADRRVKVVIRPYDVERSGWVSL